MVIEMKIRKSKSNVKTFIDVETLEIRRIDISVGRRKEVYKKLYRDMCIQDIQMASDTGYILGVLGKIDTKNCGVNKYVVLRELKLKGEVDVQVVGYESLARLKRTKEIYKIDIFTLYGRTVYKMAHLEEQELLRRLKNNVIREYRIEDIVKISNDNGGV